MLGLPRRRGWTWASWTRSKEYSRTFPKMGFPIRLTLTRVVMVRVGCHRPRSWLLPPVGRTPWWYSPPFQRGTVLSNAPRRMSASTVGGALFWWWTRAISFTISGPGFRREIPTFRMPMQRPSMACCAHSWTLSSSETCTRVCIRRLHFLSPRPCGALICGLLFWLLGHGTFAVTRASLAHCGEVRLVL